MLVSPSRPVAHTYTHTHTHTYASILALTLTLEGIYEGLRLYPPVPVGVPRDIAASKEGKQLVCGRWIPSGTTVSVHAYASYRSQANFRNPDLYAPERWLGDDRYKDDNQAIFQPFSYGPRNCLGQAMAWHEARLIMATLVSKFDMELCEESRDWLPARVYVLWEKKPLMIRFHPVEA